MLRTRQSGSRGKFRGRACDQLDFVPGPGQRLAELQRKLVQTPRWGKQPKRYVVADLSVRPQQHSLCRWPAHTTHGGSFTQMLALKRLSYRSRAARRIASTASGSVLNVAAISAIAALNADERPASTNNPQPGPTMSGIPPTFVATIGRAAASAEMSAVGRASAAKTAGRRSPTQLTNRRHPDESQGIELVHATPGRSRPRIGGSAAVDRRRPNRGLMGYRLVAYASPRAGRHAPSLDASGSCTMQISHPSELRVRRGPMPVPGSPAALPHHWAEW